MDYEIMKLIQEIHTASKEKQIDLLYFQSLWQKLYDYEKEHPGTIHDRDSFCFGKQFARKEFWRLHDRAKEAPIYLNGAIYQLELDELPRLDDRDFSSELEKLEYHMKQAVRYAMRSLDTRSGTKTSLSSLYHYCRFCSRAAADYLQNEDYTVRLVSLQDCFCPNVGHFVCLVIWHHRYFIVDPTYRQFFLAATCMEDARFHNDEPFIAPGYFLDTKEKRKQLSSLFTLGYFECTKDMLKTYADTFDLAQQSLECGPKLVLRPPKKNADDYLQALTSASGSYF